MVCLVRDGVDSFLRDVLSLQNRERVLARQQIKLYGKQCGVERRLSGVIIVEVDLNRAAINQCVNCEDLGRLPRLDLPRVSQDIGGIDDLTR